MKASPIKKNPGKKSKTSKQWMREHVSDPFVQLAQKEGYRSRAAYKLLEIDAKDQLLKPGIVVVDLGATPGGWSQVATAKVGRGGKVIALDLLPLDPLAGVDFIQGDFREEEPYRALVGALGEHKADLVISDIAPNITGMGSVDQPRAMYLAELALELAKQVLKPGGHMLVKVFQGEGSDAYLRSIREVFASVTIRKPKASRPRSREVYALARNFKVV